MAAPAATRRVRGPSNSTRRWEEGEGEGQGRAGGLWRGDRHGNLVFRHTAMNFNPMMATAARVTIAEVEELVEVGSIDPDHVHTPGIYVQRMIVADSNEKPIEQRTTRKRS